MFLLRTLTTISSIKRGVTLTLVGEGSEQKNIQDYIAKHSLNDRVTIHPSTPRVEEYLKGASIVVLTSRYEGMSIAILEAMAAGRAVVALEHPGIDEYITHNKTGFVARSESQFVSQICTLIKNHQLRLRVGRNAHKAVLLKFSQTPIAIYTNILLSRATSL